jgi:hypothetical protein
MELHSGLPSGAWFWSRVTLRVACMRQLTARANATRPGKLSPSFSSTELNGQ